MFGFFLGCSVLSVLAQPGNSPAEEIPALRPPRGEIAPTFWEQNGVWVMLLSAALVAVICLAIWFLTRPKPVIPLPPEVQARAALEPLRHVTEDGQVLSRVSRILRQYVIAAFNLPKGELNTTEFSRAIEGHNGIGPELSAILTELLRRCDRRKFAPPISEPSLGAVAEAFKVIDLAEARRARLREEASRAAQPASFPTTSLTSSPPGT